jgi:hypothetical protein
VSVSRVLLSRPSISARRAGHLVASVAALAFGPPRAASSAPSEIAAGRIALFTPPSLVVMVSVALVLTHQQGRRSGLSGPLAALPQLYAGHPALRSSDFPLDTQASSGRTSTQATSNGGQAPARISF